jgi:hypothetical protein
MQVVADFVRVPFPSNKFDYVDWDSPIEEGLCAGDG